MHEGIILVTIYFLVSFLFVLFIKERRLQLFSKPQLTLNYQKQYKLNYLWIVLVSVAFVLLNCLATKFSGVGIEKYGGDRLNYHSSFYYLKETSIGLNCVMTIFKLFSDNYDYFLFFTTLVNSLVILIVLLKISGNNKISLVFLLSTDIIFSSFTNLKQIYAVSIVAVFFYFLLSKIRFKTVICLALVIAASLFHVASLIVLPLLFLDLARKKNFRTFKRLVIFFLVAMFFVTPIAMMLSYITSSFYPLLSEKISEYFIESNDSVESKIAFLKGFPFYIFSVYAIVKRKKLKQSTPNFDILLVVLLLCSLLYLATLFSYWMFRAIYFLYIPCAIFLGSIFKRNKSDAILWIICLSEMFFVFRTIILIFVNFGKF